MPHVPEHATHRTENRPAYGVWCYDCQEYVRSYD